MKHITEAHEVMTWKEYINNFTQRLRASQSKSTAYRWRKDKVINVAHLLGRQPVDDDIVDTRDDGDYIGDVQITKFLKLTPFMDLFN